MRTGATLLLASTLATLATVPVAAASTPSFRLLGRDRYIDDTSPVPGRTGSQILRALCFAPPPECSSGSAACSLAPEYPTVEARYEIGLRKTARARFLVTSVRVASEPELRYAPTRAGRIHRWRPLGLLPRARRLVQAHLRRKHGLLLAERRLKAIDRFAREVLWHERQHTRHFTDYFAAYERIMNDPRGYPTTVTAGSFAEAREKVEHAIARDRDARLERASARLDRCLADFHRREGRTDSYASLVGACACYGGEACARSLPPFPADFPCDFPS